MHGKSDWFLDEIGNGERVEYVCRLFKIGLCLYDKYGVNSQKRERLIDERDSFYKSVRNGGSERGAELYGDRNIIDLAMIDLTNDIFDIVSMREGRTSATKLYNAIINGEITGDLCDSVINKDIEGTKSILEKHERN